MAIESVTLVRLGLALDVLGAILVGADLLRAERRALLERVSAEGIVAFAKNPFGFLAEGLPDILSHRWAKLFSGIFLLLLFVYAWLLGVVGWVPYLTPYLRLLTAVIIEWPIPTLAFLILVQVVSGISSWRGGGWEVASNVLTALFLVPFLPLLLFSAILLWSLTAAPLLVIWSGFAVFWVADVLAVKMGLRATVPAAGVVFIALGFALQFAATYV